jgi:hypothetical protein
MLPNTLFNRIQHLKAKINKYETKQLGQKVKDLYVSKYHKLPDKIAITLKSKTGEDLIRLVAVYPSEFTKDMDVLIKQYVIRRNQKAALPDKYKRS